ncbi:FecCD family ABC transporter permease [Arcanobacterium canis]
MSSIRSTRSQSGNRLYWAVLVVCMVTIAGQGIWQLAAVVPPEQAPWLYDEVWRVTRDRLIASLVIGAALGVSGVLLRTATGNYLADPQIVGVNSGAAFGAVVTGFIVGPTSATWSLLGALGGAVIASVLTISLSMHGSSPVHDGTSAVQKMVLLGLAVSALFSALTSILLVLDEAQLGTVLAWLNGRLGGVRIGDVTPAICALIVIFPLCVVAGRAFDVLTTGDYLSRAVGANPAVIRHISIIFAVVLTATCVAAAGPIGFLGLFAATVSVNICGVNHRRVFILAACIGAVLLHTADSVAQYLWAPAETPVGIVTGMAGIPLLLWGIHHGGSTRKQKGQW